MEEYLNKDIEQLEVSDAVRTENIVEITLNAFLARVEDKTSTIVELFQSSQKKAEYERGVMEFITKYIAELTSGKLCTTEYSEKHKTKQQVYVFLGTHWQAVETQLLIVFVKRCARKMGLDEIYVEDPEFMNRVIERLIYRCVDYRKTRVPPGEVWINLMNCTLEIKKDASIVKRAHRAEDFFTYVLPYPYDPSAECPQFIEFLNRVMPDADMQTLMAEYIGYCFTRDLKLEKMAVLYGTGSNGKSVILEIAARTLGNSNVSFVTLSALTCDDEKRALAEGKLANISLESNGELDTAILKKLISGEATEVRILYRGTHIMHDIPKLFTSYNRLPNTENTHAYFRRWILFPFEVTIPEEEQDVDLIQKLSTELSGILNWVLAALKGLVMRKSFTKSEKCNKALAAYIRTSNSVQQFLEERCEVSDVDKITLKELYSKYVNYCAEEAFTKFGKKNFQEILRNFGAKASSYANVVYYNIKMKYVDDPI